jgi:hypothetical protein
VSQPATRTRFLALRDIFESRGVAPDHARAAAGVLNARYPVILAAGLAGVVRRMCSRGVTLDEASRLAPTLLAFEILDRGGNLSQAVTLLRRQGLAHASAQGHSIEASNLLRETADSLPEPIAVRVVWPYRCVALLIITLLFFCGSAAL